MWIFVFVFYLPNSGPGWCSNESYLKFYLEQIYLDAEMAKYVGISIEDHPNRMDSIPKGGEAFWPLFAKVL